MPSVKHEALIEMFHHTPSLAAALLGDVLGTKLPEWHHARLDAAEANELPHTEYRADAVVTLCETDQPVLAVVVEIQLRQDPAKRWSWPVYLATLRARLKCPVVLLVVCPDVRAAAWCGEPIELGHPGWMLQPLVAGPHQIPVSPDSADLAVLSSIAHAAGPAQRRALDAATVALDTIDPDLARRYIDILFAALSETGRRYLEELMSTHTFEYQSEYARRLLAEGEARGEAKGEAKGKARGEATLLIEVLDARGWHVPDDIRARIVECTDSTQLKRWARSAVTATSLDEVFD
ncbi:hypothetical protein [Actinocatenispora comari]|uniref:Rpn family recombination-promoting nuclease/putative transposase n=1 Tax=Actinocatenispora comari TaxID=2807577 RepID=A0A8J4AGS2_9ACTN|nr:hypothetical protein [Actinocatenispora comari]GIL30394.1 hypothetical protein NUM_56480 [Actinocatenispora comari]